MLKLDLKYNNK